MILLQEREAFSGSDGNLALAWFKLAGQDLEKGGLSGAVSADQTVAVSFGKLNVYIFKQGFLPYS